MLRATCSTVLACGLLLAGVVPAAPAAADVPRHALRDGIDEAGPYGRSAAEARSTSIGAHLADGPVSARALGDAWLGSVGAVAESAGARSTATASKSHSFVGVGGDFDADGRSDVSRVTFGFDVDTRVEAWRGMDGGALLDYTVVEPPDCTACDFSFTSTFLFFGVPVGNEGHDGLLVLTASEHVTDVAVGARVDVFMSVLAVDGAGREIAHLELTGRLTDTVAGVLLEDVPYVAGLLDAVSGPALDVLYAVDDGLVTDALIRRTTQLVLLDGRDGTSRDLGAPLSDLPWSASFAGVPDAGGDGLDDVMHIVPGDGTGRWSGAVHSSADGVEIWATDELGGDIVYSPGDVTGDLAPDLAAFSVTFDEGSEDEEPSIDISDLVLLNGRTGELVRTLDVDGPALVDVDVDGTVDLLTTDVVDDRAGYALRMVATTIDDTPIYSRNIPLAAAKGDSDDIAPRPYWAGDIDGDDAWDLHVRGYRVTGGASEAEAEDGASLVDNGATYEPLPGSLVSIRTGRVIRHGVAGDALGAALDGHGDDLAVDPATPADGRAVSFRDGLTGRALWGAATSGERLQLSAGDLDAAPGADVLAYAESSAGSRMSVLNGATGAQRWTRTFGGGAPAITATAAAPASPRPGLLAAPPAGHGPPLPATGGTADLLALVVTALGATALTVRRRRT